jgi:acetyltransferase-like isoleucine patch superfamily enzyme
MTGRMSRAFDVARRHSRAWNFVRNGLHILRGRRIGQGAWVIVDGALSLERGATISGGCRITVPSGARLEMGARAWLARDVEVDVLSTIVIGAGSTLQWHSSVIGDVSIGRCCRIAPNVFVSSGQHHFDRWPELPIHVQDRRVEADPIMRMRHSRPVMIEDDCWIGTNVVVSPGVQIGRGAVIGANSVVTRDIAPYCVAAGSPARVLRERLAYRLRRQLDGTQQNDLPYFHAGFVLDGTLPPVADGPFVIALDCAGANSVQLQVRNLAPAAICIAHNLTQHEIAGGMLTDVTFPPDSFALNTGHCHFAIPKAARVEILAARVCAENQS